MRPAGRYSTPGILPFALRASLRLFTTLQEHMLSAALRVAARRVSDRDVANQIAPRDFVERLKHHIRGAVAVGCFETVRLGRHFQWC